MIKWLRYTIFIASTAGCIAILWRKGVAGAWKEIGGWPGFCFIASLLAVVILARRKQA